jgi:hypothetical protein
VKLNGLWLRSKRHWRYELELNPQKTSIKELPISIEDEAIEELRTFPIRSSSQGQRFDLLHYFNRAFALARQKPERPILRYAVGRLRRLKVTKVCCQLLQELTLQAASVEPGVWPKPYRVFSAYRQRTQIFHLPQLLTSSLC